MGFEMPEMPINRNMVTYKNKLTKILRHCKKDYHSKLLHDQTNNVKETRKILNSIMKKRETFLLENKSIKNNKDIANGFNTFLQNIQKIENVNIYDFMKNNNKNFLFATSMRAML